MKGSLFSSYFLKEGIKNTSDWKRLYDREIEDLYTKISKIFKDFRKKKRPDEADTEDDLIRPLIEILGFQYSRQKSPSTRGRSNVPDFLLFPDEDSKNQFDTQTTRQKAWNKGICILEAKRWRRPLDKGDNTDPNDFRIPSNQILRYLSVVEPASNGRIVWGILTNGELWRLYYHKAPSRAEGFIEFNLNEIFGEPTLFDNMKDQKEKFKIFYLLFRKEAFTPTSWRPHRTFLELALEEGRRWEERVAQDLKDKIFFEVFPGIARGFLTDAKTKGEKIDDTLLQEIYDNTLISLYRLLFILYAEDRGLLPLRNGDYSLSTIREEIAVKVDNGTILSEFASGYWDKVKNIFKIINKGDKSLKIPPYNGGLFNPKKHPFLDSHSIPDRFFVDALDKLSRDHTEDPPKRINYRDLSVRQLGSIYEGLLEFKLRIAETDLGIKKVKGREVYYPVNDASKAKIKKGELYLTNDRAERKTTGSYYTPDYIVQYIVKNALEPIIQKKLQDFEKWINKIKAFKNKSELRKEIEENNIPFDPKEYDSEGNVIGEKNINQYRSILLSFMDPVESLLKLKILDPAMGSGHFLVGAVDYLADRILEILVETSDRTYFGNVLYRSPLMRQLEEIRKKILDKARNEGYLIDETKLDDKNLIKRIILKRCIYGVDVNPLAVELAKVSLWLHTFTMGAPLSFLDHHLKCGNSLIGADPQDFEELLKGYLFGSQYIGLMNAVNQIEQLQELTDADISEVEDSRRLYDSIIKELNPYKSILDVYTASFFIMSGKKSVRKKFTPLNLLDGTRGDPLDIITGKTKLTPDEEDLLNKALDLAKAKRFFHWKLEFPEVWFTKDREKTEGGFDVVIGNPPYIRIQEMRRSQPDDVEYFKITYESPHGSYDIYVLFVEKGLSLLRHSGILGFILPNKFTKLEFAQPLRRIISNHLLKFVDFGDNQVFPEQTTYTGLLFLSGDSLERGLVVKAPSLANTSISEWLSVSDDDFYEIELSAIGDSPWIMAPKDQAKILRKMEENTIRLGNVVKQIFQGLITSADDVYILERRGEDDGYYRVFSEASQKEFRLEKGLLKPLVSGGDIERYFVKHTNKLLLFPYRLLPEERAELIPEDELKKDYPEAWKYLKSHESRLRGREGGKMDNYKWYGYVYPKNLDKHERPKFGVAQTVKKLEIFFDDRGEFYFHNVRVNGIILNGLKESQAYFLISVLNSKTEDFYFKQISVPHRGAHYAANKQFLEPLPIPVIDFAKRDEEALKDLESVYEKELYQDIERLVRSYPSDSGVLHDFLSFLAKRMIEINQDRYLLQLFVDGKLDHGTHQMIRVIKLLQNHPDWEDGASEDLKKEIAKHLLKDHDRLVNATDRVIDHIVYHLYGLDEEDIKIIENFAGKNG